MTFENEQVSHIIIIGRALLCRMFEGTIPNALGRNPKESKHAQQPRLLNSCVDSPTL